ncbi:hypothetical protein [Thiorhodovibrio winogradskyi]|uniref:hypothetical protein n=1 Tax=Thiorhodovibrio winogradskyi TaxID=77007 RepID=UPI002E2DCA86|nr:hypothetical protein [Thiorhodovibrio winogradskyi]
MVAASRPFVRLMLELCFPNVDADDSQRHALIAATLDLVERIGREIRLVGCWRNPDARERLTKGLVRAIDETGHDTLGLAYAPP